MSLENQLKQLEIITGSGTSAVPDIPLAQLMYYLKVVNTITDYGAPDNLYDFTNYSQISYEDKKQILSIAIMLSPDLLISNKLIFYNPTLCQNGLNSFFELNSGNNSIPNPNEFQLLDKTIHPLSVMAYKEDFIDKFYYYPIENTLKELETEAYNKAANNIQVPTAKSNPEQNTKQIDLSACELTS